MESRKSFHTRSGRKVKRKWNNVFISALIFLGVILVIWVGTNVFIKSFEQASNEETYQGDTTDNETTTENTTPNKEDPNVVDDTDAEDTDGADSSTSESEKNSNTSEEASTSPSDETGNDGTWEPIGTEQSEPHVSNYEEGSVDWNEKIKAISYATEIPEDQMQLLWLGNNGDHNSAFGVVTTSAEKENPYVVTLVWVTEKGWKPTDVVRLNELSAEKQAEIKGNYQSEEE
jgi:hypothetical protein